MEVVIIKPFDLRVKGTTLNLPECVANDLIELGHVEIPSEEKKPKEKKQTSKEK